MQQQCEHAQTQPQRLRLSHVLTQEEHYRRILANHLPAEAVAMVYNFLNHHKVHFHITRERRTKLGDYRWPRPDHPFHEISINGDLNPYLFLWVFLHEAAHLETRLHYSDVQPHGHEWQGEYARLLATHGALFPPEVQSALARYTQRIPLSHPIAKQIEAALHRYDDGYSDEEHRTLDDLTPGCRFRLKKRPEMIFTALEKRRTRWLCREGASGRQYLVNGAAEVVAE